MFHIPLGEGAASLDQIDALVACGFLQKKWPSRIANVCEIGVWHGAWSEVILSNSAEIEVLGVDPYPGNDTLGGRVQSRLKSRFPSQGERGSRYVHFNTTDVLTVHLEDQGKTLDLIHIDGEHSQLAAESDLAFAKRFMARNAVLVVDDYRHPYFPGVAAALYQELVCGDLAPFLFTFNKAYLCKAEDHLQYKGVITDFLSERDLVVETGYFGSYKQSPAVFGSEAALVVNASNYKRAKKSFRRRWQRTAINGALRVKSKILS